MVSTSSDLLSASVAFSWETLAHICGIAGLLVSVLSILVPWLLSLERYKVDILDYSDALKGVRFYLCVANLSSAPLVITSFSFSGTTCELLPKKIRGQVGEFGFQSTPSFPVTIPGHSATALFVEFLPPATVSLAPGGQVKLQVSTIAHSKEISLPLGSRSRYLNSRS